MKFTLSLIVFLMASFYCVAQDAEAFEIYNVRSQEDGSAVVYANNKNVCATSVLIEFTVLKNMKADVDLPFRAVIPAGAKEFKLFTLSIKNRAKASQLGYTTKYCYGDVFSGKHDDSYVYTIPYQHGEQHAVGQAYGGKFSHYMKGKTHAIDFDMEEGTSICAARNGIVIFVKDDSNKSGKTQKYQAHGNYVTIYHDDGSMANYFHLKKRGSKVNVGDVVKAGQVIALSGSTGWSSGPHLHFQVFSFDKNMEIKSIPTKFRQAEGKTTTIEKSKIGYKSVH